MVQLFKVTSGWLETIEKMIAQFDEIKNNTNLIPFLGAYFILYGSIDLISFYGEFDINIIFFINFSETIFYFIKDLYIILGQVFVFFLSAILLNYLKTKTVDNLQSQIPDLAENQRKAEIILANINKDNFEEVGEQKIKEAEKLARAVSQEAHRVRSKTKRIKILLVLAGLIIIVKLLLLLYYFGWFSGLRFTTLILISLGVAYYVRDIRIYFIICALASLLTSAYYNAVSNADKVKNGRNYGMNAEIDGQLIQSDSSNFIIGKTENYIFYYESKLKRTTVYPVNKLNRMTIPDK